MRLSLTLENLKDLDHGKFAMAVAAEIESCMRDMHDRPADDRARTLDIKLTFKPETDDQGNLEHTNVRFSVASKLPKRETTSYRMLALRKGPPQFQTEDAVNPRQESIDFPQGKPNEQINRETGEVA